MKKQKTKTKTKKTRKQRQHPDYSDTSALIHLANLSTHTLNFFEHTKVYTLLEGFRKK